MNASSRYLALFAVLAVIGCSSSEPEVRSPAPLPQAVEIDTVSDLSAALPELQQEAEPPEAALLSRAVDWTPRFIQTGLASGIMVEFTGMKKGKTLQAKYANIELRRYLSDTAGARRAGAAPALSGPMRAQANINNLHQAFFKIQPGTYFFRLTNPWADRTMTRGLVVREGEYSVQSNDVYAAWLRRTKQGLDSSAVRP